MAIPRGSLYVIDDAAFVVRSRLGDLWTQSGLFRLLGDRPDPWPVYMIIGERDWRERRYVIIESSRSRATVSSSYM